MAKDRSQREDYAGPLKRLLLGTVLLCLVGIFLVWRIDSPRVERFRAQVTDRIVPSMEWAMVPVTATVNLFRDFQSYQRLSQQKHSRCLFQAHSLWAKYSMSTIKMEFNGSVHTMHKLNYYKIVPN